LALGEAREGEQFVARFLQAISDGLAVQAPLADERLALRLDLLLRADVDHILVIGGKFVMQSIGSMSEKVAMLMYRAALNRDVGPQCGKGFLEAGRAVDDGEFRRLQATFDKHHRPVEDQPHDPLIGERTAIPSVPIALDLAKLG
jgi:hypothetical protein